MEGLIGLIVLIAIAVLVIKGVKSIRREYGRDRREASRRASTATSQLRIEVSSPQRTGSRAKPRVRENFQTALPHGWVVAEPALEVAGIQHRKDAARMFVRGVDQTLGLQPEPSNPMDKNAIRVMGSYKRTSGGTVKQTHIGYVPGETAKLIHDARLTSRVRAALSNVYESENGWLAVRFDLVCLQEDLQRYKEA